ncbi:MAG TPA: DUF547 domain-containing protein [Acidobacteriota bacterium]|nr:DUF547 domain-containing protein [Acidobacteriota bacterium]
MNIKISAPFSWLRRCGMAAILWVLLSSNGFAFDQDYVRYGAVLKEYVVAGRVNYAALQKNRGPIDHVIKEFSSVKPEEYQKWSREQQIAYWINIYNGWFLQIVIDHYPIHESRLIGFVFPKNSVQRISGIWDKIFLETPMGKVSLNDIEHKILRSQFKEPRIHFAIVCASIGCPKLRSEPTLAASLDRDLDNSAAAFISDPSKVKLQPEIRRIELSSIFKWFAGDFAGFADDDWKHLYSIEKAGPLAFISRYLPAADSAYLKQRSVDVGYLPYDWTLNEQ